MLQAGGRRATSWVHYIRCRFHPDPACKLSAKLYDIYHCCLYRGKHLMMDRNWPKHVRVWFQNKNFERLVHLVGSVIRNLSSCRVTWTSNFRNKFLGLMCQVYRSISVAGGSLQLNQFSDKNFFKLLFGGECKCCMLLETLFFVVCYIVLSQTEFEYCMVLLCSVYFNLYYNSSSL